MGSSRGRRCALSPGSQPRPTALALSSSSPPRLSALTHTPASRPQLSVPAHSPGSQPQLTARDSRPRLTPPPHSPSSRPRLSGPAHGPSSRLCCEHQGRPCHFHPMPARGRSHRSLPKPSLQLQGVPGRLGQRWPAGQCGVGPWRGSCRCLSGKHSSSLPAGKAAPGPPPEPLEGSRRVPGSCPAPSPKHSAAQVLWRCEPRASGTVAPDQSGTEADPGFHHQSDKLKPSWNSCCYVYAPAFKEECKVFR